MKVLITGASGFVGRHLSHFALEKKAKVYGLVRPSSASKLVEGVEVVHGDLGDERGLGEILDKLRPDHVFHLAGQASVPLARENPKLTFEVNVEGTRRLLSAIAGFAPYVRVLIACSADAYGLSGQPGKRLTEQDELRPANDYGRSKAEQERVAMDLARKYKLEAVCIRAFNHLGPGQSKGFAATDFASQVAAIEKGIQKPEIKVGNLDAVRDFSDVRDIVRGYWLALKKAGTPAVYNMASGKGHRIAEILEFYLKRASVRIVAVSDPARMRPSEVTYLVGDASKFCEETGWEPAIDFESTLNDVLEDWRKRTA